MSCEVSIASVLPYGSGNSPVESVEVKGTATDCANVVVVVSCGGPQDKTQSVPVAADGTWTAQFDDLANTGCVCNDPNVAMRVRAFCKADPDCLDTATLIPIPCAPYGCPTIDHIEAVIPECSAVIDASGYEVTLTAVIDGPPPTLYIWSFGDENTLTDPAGNPVVHKYTCPGEYVVTLTILSDCEASYSHTKTLAIELPPCGCPQVTINVLDTKDPCTRSFHAKVSDPFAQCVEENDIHWDFGDGDQGVGPNVPHTYEANGDYDVEVTLTGGVGEPDGSLCKYTKRVTVAGCRGGPPPPPPDGDCPWWNPACWNWCKILLAAALIAIFAAGVLFIIAGCTTDPVTKAVLLWSAAITGATGIALLLLWGWLCAKTQCTTLEALITLFAWFVGVLLPILLFILIFVNPACGFGLFIGWGYYGTVLGILILIAETTCRKERERG